MGLLSRVTHEALKRKKKRQQICRNAGRITDNLFVKVKSTKCRDYQRIWLWLPLHTPSPLQVGFRRNSTEFLCCLSIKGFLFFLRKSYVYFLPLQDQIVEQCIWALGNIAGDGAEMRDLVIGAGAIQSILKFVSERAWNHKSKLVNTTWVLSNLCRNKNPPPDESTVRILLPVLVKLMKHARELKSPEVSIQSSFRVPRRICWKPVYWMISLIFFMYHLLYALMSM